MTYEAELQQAPMPRGGMGRPACASHILTRFPSSPLCLAVACRSSQCRIILGGNCMSSAKADGIIRILPGIFSLLFRCQYVHISFCLHRHNTSRNYPFFALKSEFLDKIVFCPHKACISTLLSSLYQRPYNWPSS
jgi:hypothetical protein